jgi:hypothetical protein
MSEEIKHRISCDWMIGGQCSCGAQELSAAAERVKALEEEFKGYDLLLAASKDAIAMVHAQRKETNTRATAAEAARDSAMARIAELESRNRDLADENQDYRESLAFANKARMEEWAKDSKRLVWAMHNIHISAISIAFTAHVLRRGGTGDISDCETFIDHMMSDSGEIV